MNDIFLLFGLIIGIILFLYNLLNGGEMNKKEKKIARYDKSCLHCKFCVKVEEDLCPNLMTLIACRHKSNRYSKFNIYRLLIKDWYRKDINELNNNKDCIYYKDGGYSSRIYTS